MTRNIDGVLPDERFALFEDIIDYNEPEEVVLKKLAKQWLHLFGRGEKLFPDYAIKVAGEGVCD